LILQGAPRRFAPPAAAVKMESMTVVTPSASYGAGGSHVGPRLADRLGVPFIDRVIPTSVAERLAVPLDDALAHDDAVRSAFERILMRFAPAAQAFSGAATPPEVIDERSFLRATEAVIRERCAEESGVILGRAAAVVLRDRPGALHVRLDGPPERRVAQAMELDGSDRETAERRMHETDRAREAYVQQFYGLDARDAALYHLVLDSTSLSLDSCVELIALAAAARAERAG
jgi:cytidylate kinase-like protein